MSLERWFRLSCYLTLGLSSVALVFAESFFLPGMQMCLAPVLVLLVLSWWVEGRWSLPARGANLLGLLIAAGGICWVVMHLLDENSLLSRVPPHLALVPYMGPLVLAALLVKLFRPRVPGDFWRLQGLGLTQIGLGCVLAAGLMFGFLLTAYLASVLTCLALHYRLSALRRPLSAIPLGRQSADHGKIRAESRKRKADGGWRLLPFALRWTLLVSLPALMLFLLTPRRDGAAWEPLHGLYSGNHSPDGSQGGLGDGIDLNGTGLIKMDAEAAFQVAATDSTGQPKMDLPGDQRWRGGVLDWYENGRWTTTYQMPMPIGPRWWRRRQHYQQELPDLGPGQYFLTFTLQPRQAGGLVLAEPIRFGPPDARLPVVPLWPSGRFPRFFEVADTVLPRRASFRREYRYCQVLAAPADPSRTPADGVPEPGSYLEQVTSGMQEWTVDLLRRLAAQSRYRLPDEVRDALAGPGDSLILEPRNWESVSHVLTDYLANSGEFTYTLNLTRHDSAIDPVMDFLIHLKRGHCERYASALTLMLRSVGIPARVVKGFRGADNLGDGTYVVRHHHAHAWVETLAPRRGGRPSEFDWLTLDPTPSALAPVESSFSLANWWQNAQGNLVQLWQMLIINYNADQQADLWDSLRSSRSLAILGRVGASLVVVVAVWVLLRRLLRRRAAPLDSNAFYTRLLLLLRRHTLLQPASGQTPREFGETARQFLQTLPGLAILAELPGRVAELLYRVRFGGRPLSVPEGQALNAELDQLAAVLQLHASKTRRPGVRSRRLFLLVSLSPCLLVFGSGAGADDPKTKTEYYKGKVVPLADLVAKAGSRLDADAAPHWLALAGDDGKVYALVKDSGARLFFKDPALLKRPMRLTGRLLPDSQLLRVTAVHAYVKGELHDVYYWCDICSIRRGEKNVCECCGGPMRLVLEPVAKER